MSWVNSIRIPTFESVTSRLPDTTHCAEVRQALEIEETRITLDAVDTEKVINKVVLREGALSRAELRSLPYLIFDDRAAEYQPEFTNNVIESGRGKKAFFRRLFKAWIFHYRLSHPAASLVQNALKQNVKYLSEESQTFIKQTGAIANAPNKSYLRAQLLETTNLPLADAIGFRDGIATTNFARAVCQDMAGDLIVNSSDLNVRNFLNLVTHGGEIHSSLKAPALVGMVLGAKDAVPDSDLVKKVVELVSNNFPDPILGRADWPTISEELGGEPRRDQCIDIVRRWNVFRSIDLFFKVIGETIESSKHKHQFPRRKQFWMGYFQQNAVTDAWILLGRKASQHMKHLKLENPEELASLRYGTLDGASLEQSALLLRVGNLIILEWSHDGACRVWRANDSRIATPSLRRARTHRDDLLLDCLDRVIHDAPGNWVRKLHRIIKTEGNVRKRL